MKIRLYLYCVFLFISAGLTMAQQNVTSATLSGRIEDARGAVVSGADITATNFETNQRLATTSDHEGRYRFPYLRTGDYELTAGAQGFSTITKRLTLSIGQSLDVPVKLEVAGLSEQVNIGETDVPTVETVRTQITETIRPREINELPLNGRNYLDLALLVPGVSLTNTGSNQRFAETSAVPGQGISIAGQRNLYNSALSQSRRRFPLQSGEHSVSRSASGRVQFHFAQQFPERELQHVSAGLRRARPVSSEPQRWIVRAG